MAGRANADEGEDEGEPEDVGDSVLLLVNGGEQTVWFVLPALNGAPWQPRIDTCTGDGMPARPGPLQGQVRLSARSIMLLTQAVPGPGERAP
jgi:hypothetical protein